MTVPNPTPTNVNADSPKVTNLAGQVAVITGASRGIGQAIAIRLGSLGANVIVNYSRDAAGAARTVAAIQAVGSSAVSVQADVSHGAEVEMLFATGCDHFGAIDIVVANAGIDETGGPVLDVSEADYDRMFGVNAKGAFLTLQHGARKIRDGGTILFVGSSTTLRPVAGFGLYGASKLSGAYLVGVLAQEIGHRGVTVNAIIPTATDGAGYFEEVDPADPLRALVEHASPLGGRMGSVDDVADAAEFFTGRLARWVSGQQLLVSGGGLS